MKRILKLISLSVIYCLIACYVVRRFGVESKDNILFYAWTSYYFKFDVQCIHWIVMRLVNWIYIFMIMMQLESAFTIYLYVRERNFLTLFVKMYARCLLSTVIYLGVEIVTMALCFALIIQKDIMFFLTMNRELFLIFVSECISCLNFCLIAYLLYCCIKKMEISFLLTLVNRLLFGFFMKGEQIEVMPALIANIVLVGIVLFYAAHNFVERLKGEV